MTIKNDMVVGIEYTLQDANTKEQLDTNVGGAPLEYIAGKGHIIPGLEAKLEGLENGSKIDVVVQPADGYGEVNQDAIQTLPIEQFAGIELEEGMALYGTGENGETVQVTVKSLSENDVTIDYNHPMAGKTLMFTVAVLSLREATADEISAGMVGGHQQDGGCCGGGHCDDTPEPAPKEESGCCGGGHCS
ncbi:MAG: peptidylprolyl isomerase [Campylobacteraceae bacterium]|jgi:FKBP-type peptidyl-prolyl cis-trans isomerase SlyD|nr:peptidylprolyl isomerase [Campylobacteraceae bacterium]MBT3882376.1 peptidylprolyl isomerase [Campylobacteraceae bacterium]MBT4031260.1 peptidylprolyl isomerase [Campylobacteraceae bacterium]MBT4178911.1 peptidylprolyl isomerase [Campylobacteraceae bacterium]MBT4573173.1 peptidylprolyl isomerase [Campylobacteraceae bacterium]